MEPLQTEIGCLPSVSYLKCSLHEAEQSVSLRDAFRSSSIMEGVDGYNKYVPVAIQINLIEVGRVWLSCNDHAIEALVRAAAATTRSCNFPGLHSGGIVCPVAAPALHLVPDILWSPQKLKEVWERCEKAASAPEILTLHLLLSERSFWSTQV